MPPKQPTPTRAWGTRYDTLPTSPPVSPEIDRFREQQVFQDIDAPSDDLTERSDTKLPHDASVFVGSLPASVDQAELTRLLSNHLSEYAEIKSIKVIRDSKGGVCAFVQCKDAETASSFLQRLRTSPAKPFLGRTLRYEPARALRTLLISYKAPSRLIPPHEMGRLPPRVVGRPLRLELPHAIRIWKPKLSKYHRILYDMEAMDSERSSRTLANEGVAYETEDAIYMQPLRFDSESVIKLAKYFGPLEQVSTLTESHELVRAPDNGSVSPECYPLPHNTPRSECMDTACWEIKWEHRDDCVTALMVLRRVPYLSVSWAHNSQTQQGDHHYSMPGYQGISEHAPRTMTSTGRFQHYDSPGAIPLASPSTLTTNNQSQNIDKSGPTIHNPGIGFNIDVARNWRKPVPSSSVAEEASDIANVSLPEAMDQQFNQPFIEKSDSTLFVRSGYDPKLGWDSWEDTSRFQTQFARPSIIASQSPADALPLQRLEISSRPVPTDEITTPGLVMSPSTPRTALPHTPITPINQAHDGMLFVHKHDREHSNSREYDPTSLFVGGLEVCGPEAWTVGKLHSLFARFDGLLDVKMVRPPNGSTAFAFVRYNNTKSPTQAILEEHDRVYAGRPLKVQLRDINPPRSSWKHGRGRGRTTNHHTPRKSNATQDKMLNLPKHPPADNSDLDNTDIEREITETVPSNSHSPKGTDDIPEELVAPDEQQQETPVACMLQNVDGEKYREWYDAPVDELSPKSSESNGSIAPQLATPPVMPYSVPGFYPLPWMQPYPQPGSYPIPFYGPYPGYPMPPLPIQPPNSDINGFVAGNPSWHGMIYNAYNPYGPSAPEQGPVPQIPPVPLAPSGFIQHDQGALVAVYAPEALDQHMSGQNTGSNSSTHSANASATWPQAQSLAGSQPAHHPPRSYWAPAPPFVHMPRGFGTRSTFNVNAGPQTGGQSDGGISVSSASGRKLGHHKDHQATSRSSRTFNNRHGRGHTHTQNFIGNTEGVNSRYWNTQVVNGSKWNDYARR